jgi:outer membrane protein assembly factor BamE
MANDTVERPPGVAPSRIAMPTLDHSRLSRCGLMLALTALTCACSSVNTTTSSLLNVVKPYAPDVVQGNFVSREQLDLLKPGLTKNQVRGLLGTPLVTSMFHSNRWDYIFSIKRQGTEYQQRKLTLIFKADVLERYEGDPVPSEAEFISSISRGGEKAPVIPRLEASPEELQKFQEANPVTFKPQAPAPASGSKAYPPLEQEGR